MGLLRMWALDVGTTTTPRPEHTISSMRLFRSMPSCPPFSSQPNSESSKFSDFMRREFPNHLPPFVSLFSSLPTGGSSWELWVGAGLQDQILTKVDVPSHRSPLPAAGTTGLRSRLGTQPSCLFTLQRADLTRRVINQDRVPAKKDGNIPVFSVESPPLRHGRNPRGLDLTLCGTLAPGAVQRLSVGGRPRRTSCDTSGRTTWSSA